MAGRWADVGEAARELGISADAVRKRIARGSLRSDRSDGKVLVWLDNGGTKAGIEAAGEEGGAVVEVLTDQVAYLRSQLDQEREARRRADTIIAQLTQANVALAQRVPELGTPAAQPGAPETAAGTTLPEAGQGPQTVSERLHVRSWVRRVFGR
jgi:hypothetical protein